jgi:hypothetical protein
MRQKYLYGQRVKIADEMPPEMSHFTCGVEAVVKGTYSSIYGGKNIESYSLGLIKDEEVVNCMSWYDEDQLSLIDEDILKGMQMLEDYEFNR